MVYGLCIPTTKTKLTVLELMNFSIVTALYAIIAPPSKGYIGCVYLGGTNPSIICIGCGVELPKELLAIVVLLEWAWTSWIR